MAQLRIFFAFLAAATLCGAAGAADDPVHVDNPATPPGGRETLVLDEIWRIGGLDDEENVLGVIARALADEEGRVWLLDSQLVEARVHSPEGELLRTIGGQGEGPGELQRAQDMFFMPDGRVALVQLFPGKVVLLQPDGTPAGTFDFQSSLAGASGFAVLGEGRCRGDRIYLTGIQQTFNQGLLDQHYFLDAFDAAGERVAGFATGLSHLDMAQPRLDEAETDFCWGRWDAAPDGRVVLVPRRDAYLVEVRGPDGALLRTFGREYERLARDEAAMTRTRSRYEAQGRFYPSPPTITIESDHPDIVTLRWREDGSIWVLSSRGAYEAGDGAMAVFDVFDAEGRFGKQVAVQCPGDPIEDNLWPVGPDLWILLRNFGDAAAAASGVSAGDDGGEVEPLEVICYRATD